MNLPELLGLIWGGVIPSMIVAAMLVNLTANNIASHRAKLPR